MKITVTILKYLICMGNTILSIVSILSHNTALTLNKMNVIWIRIEAKTKIPEANRVYCWRRTILAI